MGLFFVPLYGLKAILLDSIPKFFQNFHRNQSSQPKGQPIVSKKKGFLKKPRKSLSKRPTED